MKKLFNIFALILALIIFPVSPICVSAITSDEVLRLTACDFYKEFVRLITLIENKSDDYPDKFFEECTDKYLDAYSYGYYLSYLGEYFKDYIYRCYSGEFYGRFYEFLDEYYLVNFDEYPKELLEKFSNTYMANRPLQWKEEFLDFLETLGTKESLAQELTFLHYFLNYYFSDLHESSIEFSPPSPETLRSWSYCKTILNTDNQDIEITLSSNCGVIKTIVITSDFEKNKPIFSLPSWVLDRDLPID